MTAVKSASGFRNTLFFRAALLLFLTGAIVAATQTALSFRTAISIAETGVSNRAAQMTGFVAKEAGGALRFGRLEKVETLFDDAISTSGGTATGAMAMSAGGEILLTREHPDSALEDLLRRAFQSNAPQVSGDGMLHAAPVRHGTFSNPVGAVGLSWTAEPIIATTWKNQRVAIWLALLSLLVVTALGLLVLRAAITRPLLSVNRAMADISLGDHTREIPGTDRADEIGSIAKTLLQFRDSLATAAQKTREALFQGAGFQGSSAALMLADTEGRIVFINGAFEDLRRAIVKRTGEQTSPLIGCDFDIWKSFDPRQRAALLDSTKLPSSSEVQVGDHYIRVSINCVRDEGGDIIGFVVEWSDITSDQRNRAIMEALDSSHVKIEVTPCGTLRDVNGNFAQLAGLPAADLCGRPVTEMIEARGETPVVADILRGSRPVSGKFRLSSTRSVAALLDGSFTPMTGADGNVSGHIFIASDTTEAEDAVAEAEALRGTMEAAQAQVVDLLRINLRKLSEGDLRGTIDEQFAPDYETLRADYNAALNQLQDALANVLANAGLISSESSHIARASEDLSKRSETQAATLEQTVASLGQITNSVRLATEGALEANKVVRSARTSAESSGDVVRQAIAAMGEIETSSMQISKIISVIDDIAFQTNLLALNAGVEAARAGEAGRGFAVVASEVRALAQRSSEAAREISTLISTSGEHVQRGVSMVGQAGQALSQIVVSVSDIAEHVAGIAVSAEEQSASLEEINIAMQQLDHVTQHNAAMFEETTAASQTLSREAQALNATLGHFKLDAQHQAVVPQPDLRRVSSASQASLNGHAAALPPPAQHSPNALAYAPNSLAVEEDCWEEF